VEHKTLDTFDSILKSAVCKIMNCSLPNNKWIQSEFPIRDGCLGLQRISTLTLPTFLASAAGSHPLQGIILSNVALQPDSTIALYLSRWSAMFGSPTPDQPLSGKPSFLDRPGILADKAMVESSLSNEHEKASFLAASAPHSGDWLLALPITACGLRLED